LSLFWGAGALTDTDTVSIRPGAEARVATPRVDICICTYKRADVVDALRTVAQQQGTHEMRYRVIVADNAERPEAREMIVDAAHALGLELLYVHAPARNISIARNACLDAASAEWVAFIDDDEQATPHWLAALMREAKQGDWDAVLGPVQAIYPDSIPHWIQHGDFHSTRPVYVRGRIETGYTGNVLIRRSLVEREKLRFRNELGRSGGEDVDFFYRLRDAGGLIGFARDAIAMESVPPTRASLAWLLKRNFRAGQTHGARLAVRSHGVARVFELCKASAKAVVCTLGAAAYAAAPARRNRYLTRAGLHCGVVARLAGMSEISFY